jgi:hypothetical protein
MVSMTKLVSVLLVVAFLGCEASNGVGLSPELLRDPLMRTEGATYTLQRLEHGWELKIPYSYANRTGASVYLVNCGGHVPPYLERRGEDGAWKGEWGGVELSCLSAPVIIEDGAVFRDTLWVYAGLRGSNNYPQFRRDDMSGTYRLRWDRALRSFDANRSGFGPALPLEARISNAFELKQP